MTYAGSGTKGGAKIHAKQAAFDKGVALNLDHNDFERF